MIDNENSTIKADKCTFWKLIKKKKIEIPDYQREYAQGRINQKTKLIREGFVNDLFKALGANKKKELDFIFGGTGCENTFSPVDGQQRLTILFLLHWYVFIRNSDEGLKALKNFKYKTRNTSEDFCEKICDLSQESLKFDRFTNLDDIKKYSDGELAKQIINQSWFTGTMSSDPTVQSMLVVIDCIHSIFSPKYQDISVFANKLKADDCPITFFCLSLDDVIKDDSTRQRINRDVTIRDMYIKMNARGVPLTDFEIFKAAIHKKSDGDDKLDIVKMFLGDNDTAEERIKLIGKFNNEYTNFFFKLIDDCKIKPEGQKFDTAMMNFINEIFRMNYFCALSGVAVPQKTYRGYNDTFKNMSGKELAVFIENKGVKFTESIIKDLSDRVKSELTDKDLLKKVEDSIKKSFKNVMRLLDIFSGSHEFVTREEANLHYFMLKGCIKGLEDTTKISISDSLVRMALYDFYIKLDKFPGADDEMAAYKEYNRFIWKVNKNTKFRNLDEVIETLNGYRKIFFSDSLSFNFINKISSTEYDKDSNEIIYNGERNIVGSPAETQVGEEIVKAKCIMQNSSWKENIIKAEDYFTDGQIWFLLDLSYDDNGYNLERFKKAFTIVEGLMDSEKKILERYIVDFERALLAKSKNGEDHLYRMGATTEGTKRFVINGKGDSDKRSFKSHLSHKYALGDEREQTKYKITKKLLYELVNQCNDELQIDRVLNEVIENFNEQFNLEPWKTVFIKHQLQNEEIGDFTFKNSFEPDVECTDGLKYTAIYNNVQRRTDSGELNSFALAVELKKYLKDSGIPLPADFDYVPSEDSRYLDDGFPNRYFKFNGDKVGYNDSRFIIRGATESYTFEEAFNLLKDTVNR